MQVVSGTFGIGAYLVSLVFGNIILIYTAVFLVLIFSIVPVLFIEEPRIFEKEKSNEESSTASIKDNLSLLFPFQHRYHHGGQAAEPRRPIRLPRIRQY